MPPTIAHKMTVDPSQQRNLLQSPVQVLAHLRVSDTIFAIAFVWLYHAVYTVIVVLGLGLGFGVLSMSH